MENQSTKYYREFSSRPTTVYPPRYPTEQGTSRIGATNQILEVEINRRDRLSSDDRSAH
jgi:hypothetical protein